MKQCLLTPAAGKRLIGKALAVHPGIKKVLTGGTLVIIAGTTNRYVAEEILASIGENGDAIHKGFFRGISLPPGFKTTESGCLTNETRFPGDVVIQNGTWLKTKTIFDVADNLREGDIILKGANALDLINKRAAILVGNPNGGTIIAALQAIIGRRARIIIPSGLEKRITGNLDDLARKINFPGNKGFRYLPIPGEIFTEIEALTLLTGAAAELMAAGGVGGAEGGIWLAISGTREQEEVAEKVLQSIATEPPFQV